MDVKTCHSGHPKYTGRKVAVVSPAQEMELIEQARTLKLSNASLQRAAEKLVGGYVPKRKIEFLLAKSKRMQRQLDFQKSMSLLIEKAPDHWRELVATV